MGTLTVADVDRRLIAEADRSTLTRGQMQHDVRL